MQRVYACIYPQMRDLSADTAWRGLAVVRRLKRAKRKVMTIFELVKIVLDELYTQGKRQHKEKIDQVIQEKIRYLSDSYAQLNNEEREAVNYKDPATRFAYVYKYVAAHGDYLVQVMEHLRSGIDANIFQGETARISCVGGGPGSDIIAVLKYLDEYKDEPVKKIICYLLDKEQAWSDTWTELGESFDMDVQLNTNFQSLDVTNPDSWQFQQRFLQADLFTMSYFVSEVHSFDQGGEVSKFWSTLFQGAKPGALFVYDDNGHTDFNNYFDAQWRAADLRCLITRDNSSLTPRYSEQAANLGDYLGKFGQQPKLRAHLSYRVLRKE